MRTGTVKVTCYLCSHPPPLLPPLGRFRVIYPLNREGSRGVGCWPCGVSVRTGLVHLDGGPVLSRHLPVRVKPDHRRRVTWADGKLRHREPGAVGLISAGSSSPAPSGQLVLWEQDCRLSRRGAWALHRIWGSQERGKVVLASHQGPLGQELREVEPGGSLAHSPAQPAEALRAWARDAGWARETTTRSPFA